MFWEFYRNVHRDCMQHSSLYTDGFVFICDTNNTTKTEFLTSISSFSFVFSSGSFGLSPWFCCSSWSVCMLFWQTNTSNHKSSSTMIKYYDSCCSQWKKKICGVKPAPLSRCPAPSPWAPPPHQFCELQPRRHWTHWKCHGCSPALWPSPWSSHQKPAGQLSG